MSEATELVAGAQAAFSDAVHALVGKRPDSIERDDETSEVIVRDSLYNELQEAKHGEQVGQGSRRPAPSSRPPGWTDALSLVVRIDQTAARWWPAIPDEPVGQPVTVRRLYALADWSWSPHELADLKQHTREVLAWVDRAKTLLPTEEIHTYELRAPCPACGELTMLVDSAGEQVRKYVLQTTIHAARCLACDTRWGADYFVTLARQLGGLPDGVLE
ncbi:DUF7341 domain-containing protein [Nocardia africana]